ncbi:hypothetical protein RJ45_13325 [Photobacterium gaetbulicola]|uniref:D-lactate dehydrogenase (cytochrome) n=1 Tax=Photobacterium gaetbulicola TaxID=1295392 RepID=A0A0B9G3N4_9GAMM|nr:FAD-binding oxidoreductase [Photobacterium gaetbulicola]KHT63363.1 hypothetical protein RJ45_13325 [Photobacterium gaetbulicola]
MNSSHFEYCVSPHPTVPESYLRDESRLRGNATELYFADSPSSIQALLTQTQSSFTVQGARTGLCGGAVPSSSAIICTEQMTQVCDISEDEAGLLVKVEAGISLNALDKALSELDQRFPTTNGQVWCWPQAPSQQDATLGGVASNNASGLYAHRYGPARTGIEALELVDGLGRIHQIRRGQYPITEGFVKLPDGTSTINVSALELAEGSCLLDVLLGSEGRFGVITHLWLRAVPRASQRWALLVPFACLDHAGHFIDNLRRRSDRQPELACAEWLDNASLELLAKDPQCRFAIHLSRNIELWQQALYIELHAEQEQLLEAFAEQVILLVDQIGGEPEQILAGCTTDEFEALQQLRVRLPELVNSRLDLFQQIKLAVDFPLTGEMEQCLPQITEAAGASGIEHYIFGHALSNHMHINWIVHNEQQRKQALTLIRQWANDSQKAGLPLIGEHGLGQIKAEQLPVDALEGVQRCWQECKAYFDPKGRFHA